MSKVRVWYADYFAQTIQRMREDGLLLVTLGADGKANVMTIGWGTMGSIWSRPVFIVLVRPSRHATSAWSPRPAIPSSPRANIPFPWAADSPTPARRW